MPPRDSTDYAAARASGCLGERSRGRRLQVSDPPDLGMVFRKNRFDAPGECLMAAYSNQQLVGIGGLSIDTYGTPDTARLRRVYVAPAARNEQVGRALVKALVGQAALHFQNVHLYTDTSEGDTFYLRCGFVRVEGVHATHGMELVSPTGRAAIGQNSRP